MTSYMNYKQFFILLCFTVFLSCKQESYLTRIEGERLEINDSLSGNQDIEDFIKPYRDNVNKNLDNVLAYSSDTYTKNDGEFNTAIGNLMADIVYEQANPVFKSRTQKEIDAVLLNHGGIRSIIPKGDITSRTAYQVMPFENSIVVVEMKGIYVKELVAYLQKARRAHPISGLKVTLDADFNITEATIGGNPIEDDNVYYVATNDYLYNGGDRMHFFKQGDSLYTLDYKIRNAMIDYFTKVDTINPVRDDRFTQTQ